MSLPERPDPRQMRCADSDRQLVAELLNSAYAEGRITLDEHEERSTVAWSARTFAELDALTTDLVPDPTTRPMAVMASDPTNRQLVVTEGAVAETDSIFTLLGTARREGHWRLRRRSTVTTLLGDCKIDLRTATLDAAECHIQVMCALGDVKIWVPEGIEVISQVSAILGDARTKGMSTVPSGSPRVVIDGTCLLGDVTIYGPEHVDIFKRLGVK